MVFLDDGGVMNDSSQRTPQWQRLVCEFFTPLLGGTPQAWADANRIVAKRLFDPDNWQIRVQAASDYASFDYTYQLDWLGGMCEFVGIPTPPEEECFALACRAVAYIIPRVYAAFPGGVDAIRILHSQGYILHTASGEPSFELAVHLDGMGVRDCFGRLYGPDLIDTFKEGPEYYEHIFADVGVSPTDTLVVDDSPNAINWAKQTGARTVLVSNSLYSGTRATLRIGSLAELPEIIQRLE
jgi:HAD superfamily hydrolase (TIGR01509 family)